MRSGTINSLSLFASQSMSDTGDRSGQRWAEVSRPRLRQAGNGIQRDRQPLDVLLPEVALDDRQQQRSADQQADSAGQSDEQQNPRGQR